MLNSHISRLAKKIDSKLAQANIDKCVKRMDTLAESTSHLPGRESGKLYINIDERQRLSLDIDKLGKFAHSLTKTIHAGDFSKDPDAPAVAHAEMLFRDHSILAYEQVKQGSVFDSIAPSSEENSTNFPVRGSNVGAFVILGAQGSGKTFTTSRVFDPDVHIRFGEPKEEYDMLPNALTANTLTGALGVMIAFAMMGYTPAVDSFRVLAYKASGAAGAKGIKTAILLFVTELSNLLDYLSQSAIILVNPMLDDDAMEVFADQIEAGATGYCLMRERSVARASVRLINGRVDIASPLNERVTGSRNMTDKISLNVDPIGLDSQLASVLPNKENLSRFDDDQLPFQSAIQRHQDTSATSPNIHAGSDLDIDAPEQPRYNL